MEDYKIIRKESIEQFRRAPCEFTYDHMLCSHGVIDVSLFCVCVCVCVCVKNIDTVGESPPTNAYCRAKLKV